MMFGFLDFIEFKKVFESVASKNCKTSVALLKRELPKTV